MDSTLLHALQQLSGEGKQPTLALLKNRVGSGYPLPQLIDAIKRYKANPNISCSGGPSASTAEPTLTQLLGRIDAMQQQIDALTAQIASMQSQPS
ncbi:hypothetical protein [uncultured Ferrimonas sp.]|uniref:hypothetical protein n=1 Tax=uncultured Ferrimonas sp. TaxID=432640 RepID=UPI0026085B22|nr:hypothetical protein [uncultured Ferrimonas sp.]